MFCGRLNITFCYLYTSINHFYVQIGEIYPLTNHSYILLNDPIIKINKSNALISNTNASIKEIIIDINHYQILISKSYASKCWKNQINELLKQQMEVYHGRAY